MTTSLARQLKALAGARAPVPTKHRASLLFDGREAADISRDSILVLGRSGLDELMAVNPAFAAFDDSLFGPSLKDQDRMLLTKPENAKLDALLNRFLRLVSPHFLRKSTFKALEWLVRRFKINEMNVDAVIACILPYHETKQFVQVVRILAIPDTSIWMFLKDSVQRSSVHLERRLLIEHCIKDPSALQFIFNMVTKAKSERIHNSTLTSFLACILVQFLESKGSITDGDLRIIIPALVHALTDTDADLRAAGQMALAYLSTKSQFAVDAFTGLLEAVATNVNPALLYASVLCAVTVCQNQPRLEILPESVFRRLMDTSGFAKVIATIAATYEADNFVEPLLKSIIRAEPSPNPDVLATDDLFAQASTFAALVSPSLMSSAAIHRVLDAALDMYVSFVSSGAEANASFIAGILRQVYEHNVVILDAIIDAKFQANANKSPEAVKTRAVLFELITSSFKGTMLEAVDSNGTTLFLSLNHPQANVRLIALQKLASILSGPGSAEDKAPVLRFAGDVLIAHIGDANHSIATFALEFPNLKDYVSADKLAEAAAAAFTARSSNASVRVSAVRALCTLVALGKDCPRIAQELLFGTLWRSSLDATIVSVVAPFVAPLLEGLGLPEARAALVARRIAESIKEVSDKTAAVAACNTVVAEALGDDLRTAPAFSAFVLGRALHSSFSSARVFALQCLARECTTAKSAPLRPEVTALLPHVLTQLAVVAKDSRANAALNIAEIVAASATLLNASVAEAVSLVRVALIVVVRLFGSSAPAWLHPDAADVSRANTLSLAFTAFLTISSDKVREHLVQSFLGHLGQRGVLEFAASLWLSSAQAPVRVFGLTLAKKFITSDSAKHLDYQLLVPSLLLALTDKDHTVRAAAVSLLQTIVAAYKRAPATGSKLKPETIFGYDVFYGSGSSSVGYLLPASALRLVEKLGGWKEEILADAAFLPANFHTAVLHTGTSSKSSKGADKYQDDILSFLLSNIVAFGATDIKIRLIQLLSVVDSPLKLKTLFPLLEKTLLAFANIQTDASLVNAPETAKVVELLCLLSKLFTATTVASLFNSRSTRYVKAFCALLSPAEPAYAARWSAIHDQALAQITPEWFTAIELEKQQSIFMAMIDLIALGGGVMSPSIKTLLKTLPLSGQALLPTLERIQIHMTSDAAQTQAKRVKSDTDEDRAYILSGVALLEVLQFKNSIESSDALIGPLFDLLAALLNSDMVQALTEIEYFKQLILSALQLLFRTQIDGEMLSINEDSVRIDLVVQCIRLTDNPQTHNAALLLLSTVASVAPQSVLINIMPVFTFMGANILRQDDSYTFHVIQQTMTTIIPALMRHINGDAFQELKPIMDVFVQALPHIPSHRRLRLFTLLVQTVGVSQHLGSMIALILSNSIAGIFHATRRRAVDSSELVQFCLSLSQQFSQADQLRALVQIMQHERLLPNGQDASEFASPLIESSSEIKTVRRVKLQLLSFASHALKSKSLATTTPSAEKEDSEAEAAARHADVVKDLHLQLIEFVLLETDAINTLVGDLQVQPTSSDAKFGRLYMHSLQDVLTAVNNLLVLEVFVDVAGRLLERSDESIRYRALVMLKQRATALEGAAEVSETLFMPILQSLFKIVDRADGDAKVVEAKQLAMECVSILAALIGKKIPEVLSDGFKVLLSERALLSSNPALASSTIVCLSSLSIVLGPRIVPFLPVFVPAIVKIARAALDSETVEADTRAVTVAAVLGCFAILVETLSMFASPYLGDIIGFITDPAIETMSPRVGQLATAISASLAQHVSPRILLPPMLKRLGSAIPAGAFAMVSLFRLLAAVIASTPQAGLIDAAKQLTAFFLEGFGYRCAGAGKPVTPKSVPIENAMIQAFVSMTMKTNETMFRPVFLKLVDWATSEMLAKNGWTTAGIFSRQQMLYRVADRLFGELRSIFVPYYAYLLDNALKTLANFDGAVAMDSDLWSVIIANLKHLFLHHGANDFISADRLTVVRDALMNQIKLVDAHGHTYKDRMSFQLVPTLGQLAFTFRGDKAWKALTRSVLQSMRADAAPVRWAAVKIMHEMYSRLGEEMLVYFPETIPIIAELMEDDDEDVEKACQDLCLLIQHYLGEPIQQYFSA